MNTTDRDTDTHENADGRESHAAESRPDDAATDPPSSPESRPPSKSSLGRRELLAGLSATGLAALAGCTVSVDQNGVSWGGGGATPTRTTRRPTAATTRTATRTQTRTRAQTRTATRTQAPTDAPTPTQTATRTATPTETTTEQEFEIVTAELEPVQYEVVTPEPTPTATRTATPTPEPVTARFGLHNFRLYVVKAGDGLFEGPGSLELIGDVEVRGFDDRGHEICPVNLCLGGRLPTAWVCQYPNTFDMDEGERAKKLSTVSDPIFVDFPHFESTNPSRAYIEVSGGFSDDDGASSMDDLGDGSVKWYLDGPQSGGATSNGHGEAKFSFSVTGDDAHVRVSFDVDRFA